MDHGRPCNIGLTPNGGDLPPASLIDIQQALDLLPSTPMLTGSAPAASPALRSDSSLRLPLPSPVNLSAPGCCRLKPRNCLLLMSSRSAAYLAHAMAWASVCPSLGCSCVCTLLCLAEWQRCSQTPPTRAFTLADHMRAPPAYLLLDKGLDPCFCHCSAAVLAR